MSSFRRLVSVNVVTLAVLMSMLVFLCQNTAKVAAAFPNCTQPASPCVLSGVKITNIFSNGVDASWSAPWNCSQANITKEVFGVYVQEATNDSFVEFYPTKHCARNFTTRLDALQCRSLLPGRLYQIVFTGAACSSITTYIRTPGTCAFQSVVVACDQGRIQFSCAWGSSAVIDWAREAPASVAGGNVTYPSTGLSTYYNVSSPFVLAINPGDKVSLSGISYNNVTKFVTTLCAPLMFPPTPTPTPGPPKFAARPGPTSLHLVPSDYGFIQLPAFTLGGDLTIEAWIRFNDQPLTYAYIFRLGNEYGGSSKFDEIGLYSETGNQQLYVELCDPACGTMRTGIIPASVAGAWFHVAITFTADGQLGTAGQSTSVVAVYMNGALKRSGRLNTPGWVERRLNSIGNDKWNWDVPVNFNIQELRVWGVGRTAADIAATYAVPIEACGSYPDLVMRFGFDVVTPDVKETCGLVQSSAARVGFVPWSGPIGDRWLRLYSSGRGSVQIPAFTIGGNMTVEMWVRLAGRPAGGARLAELAVGPANETVYLSRDLINDITAGVQRTNVTANETGYGVGDYKARYDYLWLHLAVAVKTVDNTVANMTLYADGVTQWTKLTATPRRVLRDLNLIGRDAANASAPIDMAVQEFRVWNTTRTGDQIKATMLQPIPMCGGNSTGKDLVVRLSLNQTSGAVLDTCRNTTNATRLGYTTWEDACGPPLSGAVGTVPVTMSSTRVYCGGLGVNIIPVDTCPSGSTPVYTVNLIGYLSDTVMDTIQVVNPAWGLPVADFTNVDPGTYYANVSVACVDACYRVTAVGNATYPPSVRLRPLVCCCWGCECMSQFVGDPHTHTLDGARVDWFLPGDYIALTGPEVTVHNRFGNRNFDFAVTTGLAIKCDGAVFAAYMDMNGTVTLVNNGTVIALNGSLTLGANGMLVVETCPGCAYTPYLTVECSRPGAGPLLTITASADSFAGTNLFNLDYRASAKLAGTIRGLISGAFDNDTYNDIQWRNGTIYNISSSADPSNDVVSGFIDPTLFSLQSSWAVYPVAGGESLLKLAIGRDADTQTWWTPPAARRRVLAEDDMLMYRRKAMAPEVLAAGRDACAPYFDTDGVQLSNAAFDWAALNGTVPCENFAMAFKRDKSPQIGMKVENLNTTMPTPAPDGAGRRLASTANKGQQRRRKAVTVCSAGNERISIEGYFPEGIAAATIGDYPADVVSVTSRKLVLRTKDMIGVAGALSLQVHTRTGRKATVFGGINVNGATIKGVAPRVARTGERIKLTGEFGNRGVTRVEIGGKVCTIVSQSRTRLIVTVPPSISAGCKNVIVRTHGCYGSAILPLGIDVVHK